MHTIGRIKQLTDEGRGRQLLSCQFASSVLCCKHNLIFRLSDLRITPEDTKWRLIVGCAEVRTLAYILCVSLTSSICVFK